MHVEAQRLGPRPGLLAGGVQRHRNGDRAGGAELDRVAEQIVQHLSHRHRIQQHAPGNRRRHVDDQILMVLPRIFRKTVQNIIEHRRRIAMPGHHDAVGGGERRNGHRIQDVQQISAVCMDGAEQGGFFVDRPARFQKNLHTADHFGQHPQLVAEGSQEANSFFARMHVQGDESFVHGFPAPNLSACAKCRGGRSGGAGTAKTLVANQEANSRVRRRVIRAGSYVAHPA